MFKKIVELIAPGVVIKNVECIKKELKNFKSLAADYGQWASIKGWRSVDEQGGPIPWYTYPATEYLSHLKMEDFTVFEYGSGNSTLWWARNARSVVSVEDDEVWYRRVSAGFSGGGVKFLLRVDKESYVSSADFSADIFVIDGKYRRECAEQVVKYKNGLMLILDNSDWHPRTVDFIKKNLGWMQVDFHGFGPINCYTWTTTIFVNPGRCSELRYSHDLKSKCGLVQTSAFDY